MRTHVFTRGDGHQFLLLIYPDGHLTIAERPAEENSWGPPIKEDVFYRSFEPRSIREIVAMVDGEFGEAL